MISGMRTTLDIDADILSLARSMVARQGGSIGKVISDLARQALEQPKGKPKTSRNGIPLFPVRPGAGRATLELVNQLRDEQP
jgi:hypothetical protein